MTARAAIVVASFALSIGVMAVLAEALDWSWTRAVILAPVIVMVVGGIGFLVVLWTRVAWEQLHDRRQG